MERKAARFVGDGWADLIDDFVPDETQWSDGDGDGFGDYTWQ